MEPTELKASPPSLPSSIKNNPFRKSNFMRSQSISQGGDSSPGSTESKRSKNRQNPKNRSQQPDLIVEEGFQLQDNVNEDGQNESGNPLQIGDDLPSPLKNLNLPDVFEKYLLTTDIPFYGVRTTKAKIVPVKPIETPKTALHSNSKINNDDLFGSYSAKKFIPMRSKSRIQPSNSRVIAPIESKPSVDKTGSGRKLIEKDSHSNVEKDSVKHDSPSKNSLDAETEVKEKPAFITEAPRSHNSTEKQGSDDKSQEHSGYREGEDSDYYPNSDEKNRQKNLKSWKVPKTPQSPEKPQYDPWAVLNKIRNKEFAVPKSYDHGFYNTTTEGDSMFRKTSQPRDFTVMRSKKMNLFEGIPYVPYDVFLRQDANMQNVMLKDLLKILLDKAKSLKNLFQDNYRMDRIMKNIEEAEQSALNLHSEETIGLLNAVSSLIMQEFRDSVNQIGIKSSPIFDNPNLRLSGFENEVERFYDNCHIFLDSIDHLRDCIDCYYVMSRQKDRKPIADVDCSDLLQFIARARYNLGQLYEAFRVIEKHVDAKLMWDAQNDPVKIKEKMRKTQSQKAGPNNKLKADTYKLLTELLQNKFNINRNKIAATRESKVVLNQEAEDEKFLTILQNQKQLKKKAGKALVDNRKLIILNRLLNPIEDPQIQVAIKIAQEKTQVQLGRDLVEYMASKAKVFEMRASINKDLPLKNNLEKILSNKNLTHLCFDFHDAKESQDIMNKLTSANKTTDMKEVVNNVFSHTKTKRHLGCLFDKESSNHKHLHLNEPKIEPKVSTPQLPKLQQHLRKTFMQTR